MTKPIEIKICKEKKCTYPVFMGGRCRGHYNIFIKARAESRKPKTIPQQQLDNLISQKKGRKGRVNKTPQVVSEKMARIKRRESEAMKAFWESSQDYRGWNRCQETGEWLKGYAAIFVHHIWTKGSNPALRYDPENFIIVSSEIHDKIHTGKIKELKIYPFLKKRIEYLKRKYSDLPSRWEIEYQGEIISVNQVRGKHWRKYYDSLDYIKSIFKDLILQENVPELDKIDLELRFWSRHDTNGLAVMLKTFEDAIKELGIIKDDDKKHSWKQTIEPDRLLDNNTLIFSIIENRDKI